MPGSADSKSFSTIASATKPGAKPNRYLNSRGVAACGWPALEQDELVMGIGRDPRELTTGTSTSRTCNFLRMEKR